MPFDVKCDGCGRRFRAPDKLAGKRVKCPQCQSVLLVGAPPAGPTGAQPPDSKAKPSTASRSGPSPSGRKKIPVAKPVADSEPVAPSEPNQWHVQTEDGQQYGPISRTELESWVAEGRMDGTCQVLKDGWDQWQWADEVFPQLAEAPSPPPAPAADNPFAGIGEAVAPDQAVPAAEPNPFVSPQAPVAPATSGAGGEEATVTPRIRRALADTKPWVTFLAILGFIVGGLGVLGMLLQMLVALRLGSATLMFIVLLMALGPALYLLASYYLLTYGGRIGEFLRSGSTRQLEDALVAQKSFWKLVGIVTAVVLAIYFVAIVLLVGFAGPSPMPMFR